LLTSTATIPSSSLGMTHSASVDEIRRALASRSPRRHPIRDPKWLPITLKALPPSVDAVDGISASSTAERPSYSNRTALDSPRCELLDEISSSTAAALLELRGGATQLT
jgi:hypothetical protein